MGEKFSAIAILREGTYAEDMESKKLPKDSSHHRAADSELTEDAPDPVLEVFKRDIDFTLVEKNLLLTTEQRAQQLVNATRFLRKFRPLMNKDSH